MLAIQTTHLVHCLYFTRCVCVYVCGGGLKRSVVCGDVIIFSTDSTYGR